ncbi:hypothetical protein [Lactococcus garvieae]|uniref:hypothetical protein n=1 Tax=Lactococcus garvieae TaxID=1363 RepID=UPI0013FD15FB|nr:hypothetical protein [Lactococcus garvieae]NHI70519.1 hypothetical protein [Lactococcus garvieae]NHJ08317.1 hypothetical protein [Lactococcus garvieae]
MTNKELQKKLEAYPDSLEVGISLDGSVLTDEIDPHLSIMIDEEKDEEEEVQFLSLGDMT